MIRHYRKLLINQHGFTIVELLIVVVVIAILATITIVAYNGITAQANDSARNSELNTIQKKLEIHLAKTGSYGPRDGEDDNRHELLEGYDLADLSSRVLVCGDAPDFDECPWNSPGDKTKIYLDYYVDPDFDEASVETAVWSNADNEWKNQGRANYGGESNTWDWTSSASQGPFYHEEDT